jgi:hypothetical protein
MSVVAVPEFLFDMNGVRGKRVSLMLRDVVADYLVGVALTPPQPGESVVICDENGDKFKAIVETVRANSLTVIADLDNAIQQSILPESPTMVLVSSSRR